MKKQSSGSGSVVAAKSNYMEKGMKRRLIVQIVLPAHLNLNQNTRRLVISGDV
jgi:hypothetical protein